jgi:uncharacterized SAM-binding protein YcdF (DUF218 family)
MAVADGTPLNESAQEKFARESPGVAPGLLPSHAPSRPIAGWNRARRLRTAATVLVLVTVTGVLAWIVYVCFGIRYYATHDQAQAADAIAVFGAAEYDGRPSPVLRARLMHGLRLYQEKLAPLVITLGGGEGGERHSEGGVGEEFLLARGVPERAVIAETMSRDTRESAARLALIARANGLHRIIAVSDGTHLFRIHALCERAGLAVYTSPRQQSAPLGREARLSRIAHEVLSYTAWRMGILR